MTTDNKTAADVLHVMLLSWTGEPTRSIGITEGADALEAAIAALTPQAAGGESPAAGNGGDREAIERVAAHIGMSVEYIEKAYPGTTRLDAGPILRNMRGWHAKLTAALTPAAQQDAAAQQHCEACPAPGSCDGKCPGAATPADGAARCESCDDTGDLHSPDGQWQGRCPHHPADQPAADAGKIVNRLRSSDPDFNDCNDAAAWIEKATATIEAAIDDIRHLHDGRARMKLEMLLRDAALATPEPQA